MPSSDEAICYLPLAWEGLQFDLPENRTETRSTRDKFTHRSKRTTHFLTTILRFLLLLPHTSNEPESQNPSLPQSQEKHCASNSFTSPVHHQYLTGHCSAHLAEADSEFLGSMLRLPTTFRAAQTPRMQQLHCTRTVGRIDTQTSRRAVCRDMVLQFCGNSQFANGCSYRVYRNAVSSHR